MAHLCAPGHTGEHSTRHLASFAGALLVDDYAGYKALASRGDVNLALCRARVRRKLFELAHAGSSPIAAEALASIAELYPIGRDISGPERGEGSLGPADQDATRPTTAGASTESQDRARQPKKQAGGGHSLRPFAPGWPLAASSTAAASEIELNIVECAIRPLA